MTSSAIRPPAGTTAIVHLVRHGEVDNPRGVLYGRLPGYHLSAAGQAMARRAADYLAGRDIAVLRSSPLDRAVETAGPIATEFGLSMQTDERLIEADSVFEGLRFGVGAGDGVLRKPRYWYAVRNPFRPSWGEPYREIAARVLAAVRDALQAAGGHEAVCVSHQSPIWLARRAAEGRHLWHNPNHRQCALGSVTTLLFSGDHLAGVHYATPSGTGKAQVPGA